MGLFSLPFCDWRPLWDADTAAAALLKATLAETVAAVKTAAEGAPHALAAAHALLLHATAPDFVKDPSTDEVVPLTP
eukprot:4422853-Pyramimonas_sp.AAC.1